MAAFRAAISKLSYRSSGPVRSSGPARSSGPVRSSGPAFSSGMAASAPASVAGASAAGAASVVAASSVSAAGSCPHAAIATDSVANIDIATILRIFSTPLFAVETAVYTSPTDFSKLVNSGALRSGSSNGSVPMVASPPSLALRAACRAMSAFSALPHCACTCAT